MKSIIYCVLLIFFITGCLLKHGVPETTPADTENTVENQNSKEENTVTLAPTEHQIISEEVTVRPQEENSSIDVNTIRDNDLSNLEDMNRYEYYPLDISFDDNDEYVISIMGVFSDIKVLSPEDALHSLYSVKTLLGLDDPASQLVLDMVEEGSSGNYYTFQQYYNNVEVLSSTITVSVDEEGKTLSLTSYITPNDILKNAIPTTTPKLSESDSIHIVQNLYPKATDFLSSLVVYQEDLEKDPVLIYYCIATSKVDRRMGQAVYLNANTGEIIFEGSTIKID